MKPSIGRIVHYTASDLQVYAAIITKVEVSGKDGHLPPEDENRYLVWLHIFDPNEGTSAELHQHVRGRYAGYGQPFFSAADPGSSKAIECWGWPPRV